MRPGLRAATVRVPCSTSNLGAGFDCIGLALDLYLDVSFEPGGNDVRVERAGTLAGLPFGPEDDTVVAAFRSALRVPGDSSIHGTFRMTSTIPVARGLGSSAAATIAGLLLATAASGEAPAAESILDAAVIMEGHPDNAAPALMGGLVGVTRSDDSSRAFRLPLSGSLGFAFASPPTEITTVQARRALPASVPHAAAVRSLGRVAALVHGLATGDPALLRAGFDDELHVPWRLPLIEGAAAAMEAGRSAGAFAVTISGSGSGLIAVCEKEASPGVAAAMAAAFRAAVGDDGVLGMPLDPDFDGARVLEPLRTGPA